MKLKPVIQRALISTSNKTGLVEFAKQLSALGIEIIATGNTARLLQDNNLAVTDVASFTGFPEILDGRLKTLHPKIHGGLLARPGMDDAACAEHGILPIHLLIANLYPFRETIAKPGCTESEAIEQIDIGGPTLLRGAAKNHAFVTVVVDPSDYSEVLSQIQNSGNTSLEFRRTLATKVFSHTAAYDSAISTYLQGTEMLPDPYLAAFKKKMDLRYGENPHQKAAFYSEIPPQAGSLSAAESLQGKVLSYNNLIDGEAALQCVREFSKKTPACVIVKHATPCGVALGSTLLEAYEKALACDPVSAFGGIVAFNQTLDEKTAEFMIEKQFVEVLLVPAITEAAKNILSGKNNCRVLVCGEGSQDKALQLRSISGGLLIQENDYAMEEDSSSIIVATDKKPSQTERADLFFALKIVKHVKSNGIVYARDQQILGIGSGQTSRVFSAKIAILKAEEAGLSLKNAVMASDAFFPFPDSIEIAAAAGISAIIQPGGSKRDEDVIAAANRLGLSLLLTGIRHFRH
jgi:phosphoribosylaminoimidazolecarboxamide formyltransferase / IMP cyclohydrolase